ncbi:MAG: dephospho-CoA kinase [Clostridia bacterium]|nr:dephospho-CoA kinase [Clostridia bacterium]
MIIGITGGSGTGKTAVSLCFEKHGYFIIDADKVAHKVMDRKSPCLKEVIDFFGHEYLNQGGTLNRKKLGEKVFKNKDLLENLNKITHKYIKREIEFLAHNSSETVIDAALLFESGLDKLCQKVVFVSCPEDIRIKRIVSRDGVSKKYATSRIKAQKTDEFYRQRCDYEIVNDGEQNIALKVEEILACLKD